MTAFSTGAPQVAQKAKLLVDRLLSIAQGAGIESVPVTPGERPPCRIF